MHPPTELAPLRRHEPFALTPRVLQFGAGNFLRGFFDWQLDLLNERCGLDAGVVAVRPTGSARAPLLDLQDGLFTTVIQGLDEAGQPLRETRLITCVQRELHLDQHYEDYLALASRPEIRFVVSNTTEAGIQFSDQDRFDDRPPASFPAKLARWLYARYQALGADPASGVYVLPCELIADNGQVLRAAVLQLAGQWQLESGFSDWLTRHCHWCSTLVDRIVSGLPAPEQQAALSAQLGYRDEFMVVAEPFYLWVIQGPPALAQELGLARAGLHILLVDDLQPYKQRKVGLLNGGHTCLVPLGLLAGLETVGQALAHPGLRRFLTQAMEEDIIPALPLPADALRPFAQAVLQRFANPFIAHRLSAIALNSWSKFAQRVMPQLLHAQALRGHWPPRLLLALAATMLLYRGEHLSLADEPRWLAWWRQAWAAHDRGELALATLCSDWLGQTALWGQDLRQQPGLTAALAASLERLQREGVAALCP